MNCVYGSGHCGPTVTTAVHHVATTVASHVASSGLPFTGGDVLGLTTIGVGLLAAGTALVRVGRHKATA